MAKIGYISLGRWGDISLNDISDEDKEKLEIIDDELEKRFDANEWVSWDGFFDPTKRVIHISAYGDPDEVDVQMSTATSINDLKPVNGFGGNSREGEAWFDIPIDKWGLNESVKSDRIMANKLILNEDLFEESNKPYKIRFYKLKGSDKGNLDHEEFFDTKKEAINRYREVFKKELFSLNPTVWELRDGDYKRLMNHELVDESIREGWESIDGLKFTRTGVHGEKLDDDWIDYGDYLVNKNRLQDEMLRDFKEENGYTRADEDSEEFWNEFDEFIAERGREYLDRAVNESLKEGKSPNLSDVRTIFWSVPNDVWGVYKDGDDIILVTKPEIHSHWYAMRDLQHRFDCDHIGTDRLGRDCYKITSKNNLKEDLFLAPEEPSDETPATPEANGVAKLILDAINGETDTIKEYNDLIANTDNEDIIKIIQDITAEENNHIGMLQRALEIVSPNASNIDDGMEEAESMIEEPVANAEPDFVPIGESLKEELQADDAHSLLEYNQHIQDTIGDMLSLIEYSENPDARKKMVKASFLISEAVEDAIGDRDIDESLKESDEDRIKYLKGRLGEIVKAIENGADPERLAVEKNRIMDELHKLGCDDGWFDESLITEDVTKEWKPDTSFKHIKKVLDDAKKRGKYVNNEREEVLAAIDKADKKGYTPEQRKFIRDSHAEIWKKNRSVTEDIHDKFKRDIKTAYKKWASDVERVEAKRKEAMDMIPDNASKEQISQYTDFVNNKIYPMVSDFDYEFPHNIEKGDFPFYVTYYSEYPIYEPAEGGYYYAGRDAVWSQGFNSEEEARQFLNDFIVEDGEDWEQDQDGRYTVHGKYIGQDQIIKLEPNQDYLSAIAGWHPYE